LNEDDKIKDEVLEELENNSDKTDTNFYPKLFNSM